jgi:amino acid permease
MFASLQPRYRTIKHWKIVSSSALTISFVISLVVALFVYMTFWQKTQSDIFQMYPSTPLIDWAKLLLCITMLLTFPLPFISCRGEFPENGLRSVHALTMCS